ncbi:MAG: hypothetical protein HZB16_01580 [Armatimonadetes bacterium]|nr:hypothetical protein [Armatimonadota bacterium]
MSDMASHLEIAIASIQCFTNDGTLDEGELGFLLGLALRNDEVDEDEKRVLGSIFGKVAEADVTPVVWQRIEEARRRHGI